MTFLPSMKYKLQQLIWNESTFECQMQNIFNWEYYSQHQALTQTCRDSKLWEKSLIIVQQPVAPTETYFARFWLTWPNITLIIFNILLFQTLKIRQLLIRGASRFHHLKHTFYLTLDTKNIQQNTSVNNCKSNLKRIMQLHRRIFFVHVTI